MRPETAQKLVDLTQNLGRKFEMESASKEDGLVVTWDFTDEEVSAIIELEHPGTAPELVEERFETLVKEIVHASIEHAKKAIAASPGAGSDE
jgi:hypothetical protein